MPHRTIMSIPIVAWIIAMTALSGGSQALIQLTSNAVADTMPEVSDDGRTVVWVQGNDHWIATAPSYTPRRLAAAGPIDRHELSGDGRWIAYTSGSKTHAYLRSTVNGADTTILQATRTGGISVSHDGRTVALGYIVGLSMRLVTYDRTTASLTTLTTFVTRPGFPGVAPNAAVSGDGTRVLATATTMPPTGKALLFSSTGALLSTVTNAPRWVSNPRLDYSGQLAGVVDYSGGIFVKHTNRPLHTFTGRQLRIGRLGTRLLWVETGNVDVSRPDGTGRKRLTNVWDLDVFPPRIQPRFAASSDGALIVFESSTDPLGLNPERDAELFLLRDSPRPSGAATPGGVLSFTIEEKGLPGAPYLARFALGTTNGVVIPGSGRVPLALDALFWLSGSNVPLFQSMQGGLSTTGRATYSIALPNVPQLRGISFVTAYVAGTTMPVISPAVLTTIR